MKRVIKYTTEFVDYIPNQLEEGILYVCIKYNIVAHSCMCGCGEEIFTPISNVQGWNLLYDGKNASLSPSVGNEAYPCKSHYFLKNGVVKWIEDDIAADKIKVRKNSIIERIGRIIRDKFLVNQ